MATLRACSIFDEKAESFNPPVFVPAVGLAARGFQDEMQKPESFKHRGDFKLYHVGDFDTVSGAFESIMPPRLVLNGSDISNE